MPTPTVSIRLRRSCDTHHWCGPLSDLPADLLPLDCRQAVAELLGRGAGGLVKAVGDGWEAEIVPVEVPRVKERHLRLVK